MTIYAKWKKSVWNIVQSPPEITLIPGEEQTITFGWGADNSIAEIGTYYVIIDLENKSFLLSEVSTAIESVEAAGVAAEYYNLQGVKVANPENGIFIKKQGNKATKVVL